MRALSHTFRNHWPEYLIEAAALGSFMISANLFAALLNHPESPLSPFLPNEFARRALGGLAMGMTAICIVYSPWGQRSGAHMNPALTLGFFRLGKIKGCDAFFYIVAQVIGGTLGVLVSAVVLGPVVSHPSINYAVTVPGPAGALVAFGAEFVISCGMMLMVLVSTNTRRTAPFTGLFAGMLVFLFITFEAPLSGMSMNPARTSASALPSGIWTSAWIYFTAPLAGMLLAAEIFLRWLGVAPIACPKLHHGMRPCIFCAHRPATRSIQAIPALAANRL
jgi:aquaporin Z